MKFAKKDADGKVPTEHRNIYVHPTKTGYIDQELFSGPGYVSVSDPYKDPKSLLWQHKKDAYKKVADMPFKDPGSVGKGLHHALFEHMTDLVVKNRNYKDADGKVVTAPWNFVTTNAKKGDPATTPAVLF